MKQIKPTIKKLLIEAMTNGKYKHATGRLKKTVRGKDCHCVLGITCDLYHKATGKGRWVKLEGGNWNFVTRKRGGQAYGTHLPTSVMKWAGLQTHFARLPYDESIPVEAQGRSLTDVNDYSKRGYKPVVKFLEKYF